MGNGFDSVSGGSTRSREKNVLVVLCDTTTATAAVFATKGLPRHARNTEVFFIKLPQLKELLDHFSLLVSTAEFGDVPRVFHHGHDVEKGR